MYGQQIPFYLLFVILLIWKSIKSTGANPIIYDQRQAGDVNVQVDLRDLRVIALINKDLLESYTDYDYVYDYEDMTVKPTKPSNSTSSTTAKPESTWPTVSPITSSPSSSSVTNVEIASSTLGSSSITTASSIADTEITSTTMFVNEFNVTSTSKIDLTTESENGHETLPENSLEASAKGLERKCLRGTIPVGNGRCKRINRRRSSFLPRLALKYAPKLSENGPSKDLRVVSWMSPRS